MKSIREAVDFLGLQNEEIISVRDLDRISEITGESYTSIMHWLRFGRVTQKDNYEYRALTYAETHGIIEYYIKENKMIYYSSYPLERSTVKAVVNLDTLKEKRAYLKRYYKAYDKKVGGRVQANYCI